MMARKKYSVGAFAMQCFVMVYCWLFGSI